MPLFWHTMSEQVSPRELKFTAALPLAIHIIRIIIIRTHANKHVHMNTCAHIHIHSNARVREHAHTHTHLYTKTCTSVLTRSRKLLTCKKYKKGNLSIHFIWLYIIIISAISYNYTRQKNSAIST